MEQSSQKQTGRRRSREEIIQLLSEYAKSQGTTVKEFCKIHQINEGAFYSARKRHLIQSSVHKKPTGFIAIKPSLPEGRPNALFAEVNGIKLYQAVPAAYLKTLIS
jgi:hypothetical protein